MIRHMRHGSPPRLLPLQSILSHNRRESLPTPSAGVRITWHKIAPRLAKRFTVVAPDLRGYGDSAKPEGGERHVNYSKRAMAADQVEVMRALGFERFAVVGHDRGVCLAAGE